MNSSAKYSVARSPQKRALLDALLREEGVDSASKNIPRRGSEDFVPLSFAQQRLWFLDQLRPGNSSYNLPAAFRLSVPLSIPVLEKSLNEIVRRHEVLRTTFSTTDGGPGQVVSAELRLPLRVTDLRHLPAAEREAEAIRLATAEAQQPFDLSQGPLVRTSLLRLDEADFVFLFNIHHVVTDGWSMNIFFQELTTLYSAFVSGRPSPLPELPIQYADYAVWQREWLQGEVLEAQVKYWREQLRDLPLLQLRTDRPRPSVQTFRGAQHTLELSQTLTTALKGLSQREGATLFMTLLTAFKVLLYRYTGQDDIVVGSPIAGRNRAEIESLIGFFVNTLVLRTRLEGEMSCAEVLRRVREVCLGAYAHQDMPFEMLVERLQPDRDLSRNPLFQVMLQLQNTAAVRQTNGAANQPLLPVNRGTAIFDMAVNLWETAAGLRGQIEYNTDLFDAATIERLAQHFRRLLEAMVTHPDQPVSQLALLSASEQRQLLKEWNATAADYPRDLCIHQLFEAQVERTPEAVAVVFEKQRLTYRELNHRANQLAHYLQHQGVGVETLVGVMVERSVELVVSLLAVLKAGAAYVPLDPAYPKERLQYMIADAGLALVITQSDLAERLSGSRVAAVRLDTQWSEIEQQSIENVASGVSAENLAYVIYTSGSTGWPKGVMVKHAGLLNVAETQFRTFELKSSDRVLQFSSASFDASVFEMVMAIRGGATLCLVPRDSVLPGPALVKLLHDQAVTIVTLPPSVLAALPAAEFPSLRTITVAGEACPTELVTSWAGGRKFFNLYGPTEATIWSSFCECWQGNGKPRIGRAISNTELYILDDRLMPTPVGVVGQLFIGGAGLARGYLNRAELTAERFIPHPFSSEPGRRLYKSGDLGLHLADGNIEFVGRIDHQVKLRGFRIEPGEIESVINQYAAVRENVVQARDGKPGEKRLVSYLVPESDSELSTSGLRNFLQTKLPQHMIPSAFVLLDALPLTASGKVDRRALPAPDESRTSREQVYVAPASSAEKLLAKIWGQVLGVQRVGVHDNFFELGGDSILSIQVIARANQAGLRLAPEQLFRYQTIAELATMTDTTPVIHAEQALVTGPVPLTPIQHWFFEQELIDRHHFNQSVLLDVGPALSHAVLERVLQSLVNHHDALRLRFLPDGRGWKQMHADPDQTACMRVDLAGLSEVEQRAAIETSAAKFQASLNLSEGPLVRMVLFDLGATKSSHLLLVVHHLVVDGVSWRILLDDMKTAFGQVSRGEAIQLQPKTTSFQHWAGRLAEHAQTAKLQQEAGYWLTVPNRQISRLLTDYAGGDNTVASTRTLSVSLGVEQTQALLQDVPKVYNTQVNDVLLTALVLAFARWTGEPSLLLDLEGHGREALFEDVDLTRTVGWFTSLFPVWLELEDESNPGNCLKSIKEQLRQIPGRGIGYGLLRYLSGDSDFAGKLRSLPQPQVNFNYLGQFGEAEPDTTQSRPFVEALGPLRSERNDRRHLLEINSSVVGGRLQVLWTYSEKAHRQSTIDDLAGSFMKALQELITHCQTVERGGYTPSDFPQARVRQEDLDNLITKLSQTRERSFEK